MTACTTSTGARRDAQRPDAGEEYRSLWAMSRGGRIAAMWRGELTTRQLCQWSSRAQHEVPLLGGEFAWIVMRTPNGLKGSTEDGQRRTQMDTAWTTHGIHGHCRTDRPSSHT